MKQLFNRFKEGSSWAGLATALAGFNVSTVVELGSTTWWTAVVTVVGGAIAFAIKER